MPQSKEHQREEMRQVFVPKETKTLEKVPATTNRPKCFKWLVWYNLRFLIHFVEVEVTFSGCFVFKHVLQVKQAYQDSQRKSIEINYDAEQVWTSPVRKPR